VVDHRHKVFVSYHHANDEYYKNRFEYLFGEVEKSIVSRSVQIGDIDPYAKTEYIRQQIRDRFLRDSTVTVVLVGSETWKRKHVDWEIGSSLRKTAYSSRSGLVGILLPTHPSYGTGKYDIYTSPPRLHDNIQNGFAKMYQWSEQPYQVQGWIHEAYTRRNSLLGLPDNSRDTFRNNRSGERWSQ
jgi:hypothetical protein